MNILTRKPEIIIAEFAGHDDIVIDCHVIQVLRGEALENACQAGARAAAAERQRPGQIRGDAFGVEQAEQ
jgi:hypothetical protein